MKEIFSILLSYVNDGDEDSLSSLFLCVILRISILKLRYDHIDRSDLTRRSADRAKQTPVGGDHVFAHIIAHTHDVRMHDSNF